MTGDDTLAALACDARNAALAEDGYWLGPEVLPGETLLDTIRAAIAAYGAGWVRLRITRYASASCAYCGTRGDLEPINAKSMACRNLVSCEARQNGDDPVRLAIALARAVGKDARSGRLGASELARLALVLDAAAEVARAQVGCRMGSARAYRQARTDEGCRRCGAIGLEQCKAATGTTRRAWHAVRKF